jgi:hypothetical protein
VLRCRRGCRHRRRRRCLTSMLRSLPALNRDL